MNTPQHNHQLRKSKALMVDELSRSFPKIAEHFINAPNIAPTKAHRPRVFKTYYYYSSKDSADQWARIGRACTRNSAIRAAIGKMLDGIFKHVDIYDEDGLRCAIIMRKGDKYVVVCV